MADPALPELANRQDRIPITHDRQAMTRHFRERVAAGKASSGAIIESLLLVWTASRAAEWRSPLPQ
jgi:hypothetical protein